ncbi:Hypothetical predicted protein [Mytilus galloprovincialis]|uniref:KY-like immunoglobulin-like domain-containing protein n=1 Tax=Mytilus galloprovincialis TaxID=29158 RepID=A0A8B6GJ44_MYTGA|nr:Hypothetical predicted protein [Mytilus galloprovincialis]
MSISNHKYLLGIHTISGSKVIPKKFQGRSKVILKSFKDVPKSFLKSFKDLCPYRIINIYFEFILFQDPKSFLKSFKDVPKSFLKSFKDLLEYFERPLQDKKDKHQLLVRSFLTWLGGLDIPDAETLPLKDLKENDSRSPDEYLKLLKKNLNIFNSIFILLCWAAGIKCFKIKGVYKTDGYDNVALSEWAVVKINGAWQIVHPYRICRALSGKFPQGWLKSTTEDLNTSDVEILKTSFLDYYINQKPEQFIYEFFPDDTDWQLLPAPITEKQFLKQEAYHHTWWETGLRLTSRRQYRITSTKGKVSITLHGTEQSVNNLVLWYDLNLLESIGETREDTHIHGHDFLQRSVFLVRNGNSWVCKVLLPVKGTYRIVFYGGKLHKPLTAICQFSLICKEAYKEPVPLAVDPRCVGLGPGPFARMCGLISPTYKNGVIQLEMNNTLKLKFRVGYKLPECFKIKANFYNSNGIVLKGDTTSMADCSISNTLQGKEVTITVTTPDDPGYYMLELLTNKDETKWTIACYYLLVYKALTQVFIELLDDIVKELGQIGLVLKIENVRKTAAMSIRFTSEQIKFISKEASRVYNTVQGIVDWML